MENQLLHSVPTSPSSSSSSLPPQVTRQQNTSKSSVVVKNRIKNVLCSNYHRKGSVTLYSYLFLFLFHSTIFIKTIQSHAQQQAVTSTGTTTTSTQQCEYKVLEEIPPDPNYDFVDITIEAATELAVMMSRSRLMHHNATIEANRIAKETLAKEEDLLAVAIAAPKLSVAVVQFRDQISIAPPTSSTTSSFQVNHTGIPTATSRSYLSAYWRELGAAWNQSAGEYRWGTPFRDCGPLVNRWLWPFSATVVEHGQKVVATLFIAADLDECNDALEPVFGRKHSCDRETTFCLMSEMNISAPRGKYTCICREGFYLPNEPLQGFTSAQVESGNASLNGNYSCIACPGGCFCDNNGKCLLAGDDLEDFSMETLLKTVIGVVLGSCMFFCVVLAIIVARQRKCKTIATGMWTVLETILLGIFLLYLAVALHFLPASTTRCLLEPWLRELGFCVCYGAIGLKLYRYLVEFRTRKAHRWVVRDLDLLRYLCAMVIAVLCYLCAFTASSLDFIDVNGELIWHVEVQDANVTANMCRPFKWDYVTEAGEILILVFALQLAYATRNASTQFRERQFLVASILIEFVASSVFYVIRAWYLIDFSPGTLFLALFIRSQLTNTITLGLIFLPKLWYQQKQGHPPVSGHHNSGVGNLGTYANIFGDPELGDLTIAEMTPEEIRAELKRLYTQLEVLKNKTLRQDNPHISKRRGGRKVAHRRFSLQKKGSKALSAKRHRPPPSSADIEVTEAEPSRTPEDSVCSIEGGEMSGVSVSK
ncbi:metabotropic glycine receptor [Culicoides brevitarsis]|uniref:metabotropic glycine receptor n=1 Tax=Culicoides brevitarsis TaxID=469753 RepID=UPI00307C5192